MATTTEVVGLSNSITVIPTIDTAAYASGDRLGSIQVISNAFRSSPDITRTFSGARTILTSIKILDLASQNAGFDILFFNALPTVTSADNAPINISDAEMSAKWVGTVSTGSTYVALSANSNLVLTNVNLQMTRGADQTVQTLWAVPIIRASVTYGSASALQFTYEFLQD